jgi:hypothetical protein
MLSMLLRLKELRRGEPDAHAARFGSLATLASAGADQCALKLGEPAGW